MLAPVLALELASRPSAVGVIDGVEMWAEAAAVSTVQKSPWWCDGNVLLAGFAWAATLPWLGRQINRIATNSIARATSPRPRPYSLWSPLPAPPDANGPITDYASWPSLTDRSFSARHQAPGCQWAVRDDHRPFVGAVHVFCPVVHRQCAAD